MSSGAETATSGGKDKPSDPLFTDPLIWKPECPNWTLIDWEKFEASNPKPPQVYYPPQMDTHMVGTTSWCTYYLGRSKLCNVLGHPCSLASCCHMNAGNNAKYGTRKTGLVEDDSLFVDLLRPEVQSEATPDVLKGVIWMRDNVAPENVFTFSSWAWKSSAVDAGKGEGSPQGVIGVGSLGYNWTNDGTIFGWAFSKGGGNLLRANVQMSPSGKWIAVGVGRDFSAKGKITWLFIYVVQEGDDFTVAPGDEDGDDEHALHLHPGDLIRMSFGDESDPYLNKNQDISYMYVMRRIAMWDAETETLIKIQPDFDDYRRRATTSNLYDGPRPLCCGLCACNLTPYQRADLARKEPANRQYYTQARPPPKPEQLDSL